MTRTTYLLSLLLGALVLAGCAGGSVQEVNERLGGATAPASAAVATPAATERARTATPAARAPSAFRIEQRATSDRFAKVELLLRSAEVAPDALTLRIAIRNTTDEALNYTGTLSGRDAVLVDGAGTEYKPTTVSDRLRTSIEPEASGFVPGAATVGTLTFSRPGGAEPYELRFPTFSPLRFKLEMPLAQEPRFELPRGTHTVNKSLRGTKEALARIELRIATVQVAADGVTFDLAFVNTGRQGYNLVLGPKGGDARLLDADGSPAAPRTVGDPLKDSIAPKDGWQPGQEHKGTLTFPLPRPEAARTLRLLVPGYDAVTLTFDTKGIAEAQVTSATGAAPRPAATPSAEDAAAAEIERLLTRQAEALRLSTQAAYLETFDAALHEEQRRLLERVKTVPLTGYTLRLAPDARLSGAEKETLANVAVEVSYGLRGIDPENTFLHTLRYDFSRAGGAWRVSKVDDDENPPFWLLGDVTLWETPHFLIFARPDAASQLPALEREVETAYGVLGGRGLPLEGKYVAYLTGTESDFNALTGRPSGRTLGVALSRYAFSGEQVVTRSRAFYLNGAAFTRRGGPGAAGRQETVTHELVHLALAKEARPFMPPWLAEGIAVYHAGDSFPEARRRLKAGEGLDELSLERLTRAGALGEHDFTGTRGAYEYVFSGETVAYLAETFGEAKLLEFYRSYAAVPAATVRAKMPRFGGSFAADAVFADLSAQLTAEAVQRHFGTTLPQIEAEVKSRLRR